MKPKITTAILATLAVVSLITVAIQAKNTTALELEAHTRGKNFCAVIDTIKAEIDLCPDCIYLKNILDIDEEYELCE